MLTPSFFHVYYLKQNNKWLDWHVKGSCMILLEMNFCHFDTSIKFTLISDMNFSLLHYFFVSLLRSNNGQSKLMFIELIKRSMIT